MMTVTAFVEELFDDDLQYVPVSYALEKKLHSGYLNALRLYRTTCR
jgi:hypothetical protein